MNEESQNTVTVYACTECGAVRKSRGRLHAHAEKHRGLFGLHLPWKYGDAEALEEMTEEITKEFENE